MLITIFSYERKEMLSNLMTELNEFNLSVIDDGSEFTRSIKDSRLIRTRHEGKRGFWKKWVIATQIALGSEHDWFLFLPDDVNNVNIKGLEVVTEQGWDKHLIALNVLEFGDRNRWGNYWTGQKEMTIKGVNIRECGYVDGAFLTNRTTLELLPIDQVPNTWFDRADKSSGVGHQMTTKLGKLRVPMLVGSFAYHGAHDSVMHADHRKKTPLITI